MAFNVYEIYTKRIIDYLASQGYDMILQAQATKDAKNRSYNQKDAYGALVYLNGELKEVKTLDSSSKGTHKGWPKHGIPDGTGREWLQRFIDTYKAPDKGFVLVVVNAAFYTRILEEGMQGPPAGHEPRTKYKIISQVFGKMDDIAEKLGGGTITRL